ncbi:hypothetical protein PoB_003637400 [Plakobranchus ocellatus]|uniref:Uncharacterized protein n=1 Tax=Plakobranchus ocellatus TaxID=259542 RepID=A0AAV4AUV0_9GAST|nr:hypothetical protein PoB_003637400 [Plakobranchus ocellatus]
MGRRNGGERGAGWGGETERKFGKVLVCSQFTTSAKQDDLMLSGPPSGQGTGGGAQTHDRGVSTDLKADSLATLPPQHGNTHD